MFSAEARRERTGCRLNPAHFWSVDHLRHQLSPPNIAFQPVPHAIQHFLRTFPAKGQFRLQQVSRERSTNDQKAHVCPPSRFLP
jgi:hypothetical protein